MTLKIINNANVLAADTIAFTEGGAEAMRIDSSGNVLVGTTSAVANSLLNVNGGINSVSGLIGRSLNDTFTLNTQTQPQYGANFAGSSGVPSGISGYYGLAFATNGAEAMRIDSSGDVLVGTTSDNIYAQNTINGIGLFPGTSPAIQIANDPQGSSGNACLLLNFRNNPVNGAKYIRFFYNGTSDIGNITLNGTTAVAYNTSSDYRLKENVIYNLNGIERVKLLKPARFNFITDASKIVDGFLAHEVSNIVPEAITGIKDEVEIIGNITDNEGNIIRKNVTEPNELPENQTWTQTETRPVYQGIDQSKLVPLLTGALQEAIAKIESLEARLTALESN